MSGGTPVAGGGLMRQRYSQGYFSGGEDLEDDAISRTPRAAEPVAFRAQTWTQVLEDVLWIGSAVFMVYFGDRRSNLISLLVRDNRINRPALYLGLVGMLLNLGIISYAALLRRGPAKSNDKYPILPFFAPLVTILGSLAFFLFSVALWPIWSFLSIPLLFTLFMAFMVVSPYLPIGPFRLEALVLHANWALDAKEARLTTRQI